MGLFKAPSSCVAHKPAAVLPNPNPQNFRIAREERIGHCTLVLVHYPDCVNFEGNKIMVYWDVGSLLHAEKLDPHFCEEGCVSPIARFVPTAAGWRMARAFAEVWT